jgi:divalent metal cation (Fe/Co/Zn/Cd) transporter
VVLAIFISALVALGQTIERFVNPRTLSHLWLLAAAGAIGFVGNEIAAQIRLRAGAQARQPGAGRRRAITLGSTASFRSG